MHRGCQKRRERVLNIVGIEVRLVLVLILLAISSRHLARAASWYHRFAYEDLTTLHPQPICLAHLIHSPTKLSMSLA